MYIDGKAKHCMSKDKQKQTKNILVSCKIFFQIYRKE